MEVISKVKSVQSDGTFDSKFGLLYKFEYQFEDGVVITANHKTETGAFKVGDDVAYTIKGTNTFGTYGSVSKPESPSEYYQGKKYETKAGEADVQTQIIRQSSLKVALDFLNVNPNVDQGNFTLKYFLILAEDLTEYVKKGL